MSLEIKVQTTDLRQHKFSLGAGNDLLPPQNIYIVVNGPVNITETMTVDEVQRAAEQEAKRLLLEFASLLS